MKKQDLITGQSEHDEEITTDTARSESAANFTIEIEDENVSVPETRSCQSKQQLEESKRPSDEEEKKTLVENYEEVVQKIVCKH